MAAAIVALSVPASAATYNVTAGTNLNTLTPVNGDVWNLLGDTFLSNGIDSTLAKTLPAGSPGLSITGNGTTVTLHDSSNRAAYFAGYSATTLSLSNLTLTGGNNQNTFSPQGVLSGAIGSFGLLTLNATGDISITHSKAATPASNPSAFPRGGALNGFGGLVINGAGATLLLSDNQAINAFGFARGSGGAIFSGGAATITVSALSLQNNTTDEYGGGMYASSGITLNGALSADNNRATSTLGKGGALYSAYTLAANNDVALTNNYASRDGGATWSSWGTSLGTVSGNVLVQGNTSENGPAAIGGGGVFVDSMNLQIGNAAGTVTLRQNTASANNGGAIYTRVGTSTLTGSLITLDDNTAATGGAIYSTGNVLLNGTVLATQNRATNGNGGLVYTPGDLSLTALATSSFTGNSATLKGGAAWVGGNVTLNATGNITFSNNQQGGPSANALYMNKSGSTATATFNANAGSTIAFFDPLQNNAVRGLVSVIKSGGGMVSFDGSLYNTVTNWWSPLYGNTQVQAGTFEVANNAVYGALSGDVGQSSASTFGTSAAATLQGGATGTVKANTITFDSNATLDLAGRQPTTRAVFTLTGNTLALGSASNVLFNTFLNDGVVQNTDVLVIDRAITSGQAALTVTNVSGPGAQTTGDGILLVQAINGATTPSNAFVLNQPVSAGIYQYFLYKGGVGANAGNGNWYLRSTSPSISLTKSANVSTLPPGGTIVYTVTVINVGSIAAQNIVVSDPLPAGITSASWTCAGTCPASSGSGAVSQTIPTLATSASATYTITATVSATPPPSILNTATASGGMLCAPADTPAPCTASAAVPPVPVLQVVKTATSPSYTPGGQATFSLSVANVSNSAANGSTVDDPLPTGITSYNWTCAASNGAACPNASGTGALHETIATFPANSEVTYTLNATVDASPPATITNTATSMPSGGGLCVPGNTAGPCTAGASISRAPVTQEIPIPVNNRLVLIALGVLLATLGASRKRRH